jgi:hypothetical protein
MRAENVTVEKKTHHLFADISKQSCDLNHLTILTPRRSAEQRLSSRVAGGPSWPRPVALPPAPMRIEGIEVILYQGANPLNLFLELPNPAAP